jgi:hypothetical protein
MPLDQFGGGCRYLGDDLVVPCGAPTRPGSSYCERHHALCHLAVGSRAEARRLQLIERLAEWQGRSPRRTKPANAP